MGNMRKLFVFSATLLLVVVGIAALARYIYRKDAGGAIGYQSNNHTMLTLTSPAFKEGETIPTRFTCEGDNSNPELRIEAAPQGAASLALLMDDPDIPQSVKESRGIEVFDHWVVFNIPPETTVLAQGQKPPGVEGRNSAGNGGYRGPCPPDGEHRYFFKLYALDTMLDLNESATKADVEKAMEGHIIEETRLMGVYKKVNP